MIFGLLSDFDAGPQDVIWYVNDYLSLLDHAASGLKETVTNVVCSTVIQNSVTAAIAEANSQIGFVALGNIDTTSQTMSAISDYKSSHAYQEKQLRRAKADAIWGTADRTPVAKR